MKASFWQKAGHSLAIGLLLFGLRLAQNRTGFDPETGLSVPCLPGYVLIACLAAALAAECLLQRKLPREKLPFGSIFAASPRMKLPMVLGGMLLAAGGAFLATTALLDGSGIARIMTGLLSVVAGFCLILFTKQVLSGRPLSMALLLPNLFFGVFLVLTVYLPAAEDPVLARYYIQILATAAAAYAFSQLAGFFQRESRPRRFAVTGNLAVMLSIAAIADDVDAPVRLLFAGCVVVLTVFLLLMRREASSQKEY